MIFPTWVIWPEVGRCIRRRHIFFHLEARNPVNKKQPGINVLEFYKYDFYTRMHGHKYGTRDTNMTRHDNHNDTTNLKKPGHKHGWNTARRKYILVLYAYAWVNPILFT